MKIRLITFHTPKNYGAVLQAYSLMSFLKKYSDDVKIIDYNTPALREKYPIKPKPKGLKQYVLYFLLFSTYQQKKKKYEKFDSFVAENMSLTPRYESLNELISNMPEADVIFTGSDQVFNPSRIDEERKVFYLGFVSDGIKRIAYAASFGMESLPADKKNEISGYLRRFDAISVREHSGVDMIKELINTTAVEVLDPVFLNDKDFWIAAAAPYKEKIHDYVFYYRLLNSPESDAIARRAAKEKHLKLVVMTDGLLTWKADKVLRDVGPKEFLYLMYHADYIVTNSFHGVAFSLIFEKEFAYCDMNGKKNFRGRNLLQKLGIEQFCFGSDALLGRKLNYTEINERLFNLKAKSIQFISDSLVEK